MLKCGNKAVIGDGCVKDKICLRISPGGVQGGRKWVFVMHF